MRHSKTRYLRNRRRKLWEEYPYCRFCSVLTVLPEDCPPGKAPPNQATIEHLDSRYSPERGKMAGERTTLACWKCNNTRNCHEQRRVPIEVRRERSQHKQSPSFPELET